jgi:hypothetical protein
VQVSVPAFGVVTLYGRGTRPTPAAKKPAPKSSDAGSATREEPSTPPATDGADAGSQPRVAMGSDGHTDVPDGGLADAAVITAGMVADAGGLLGGRPVAGTDRAVAHTGCAAVFGKHSAASAYLGPAVLALSSLRRRRRGAR